MFKRGKFEVGLWGGFFMQIGSESIFINPDMVQLREKFSAREKYSAFNFKPPKRPLRVKLPIIFF